MGFGNNRRPSRDTGTKRDMSGKLWPNDKRRGERDPTFTGVATVDGRDYRVSAWDNDDGTVAIKFRDKTEARRDSYEQGREAQRPAENYRYDQPPTAPNTSRGYRDDRAANPPGPPSDGWEPPNDY